MDYKDKTRLSRYKKLKCLENERKWIDMKEKGVERRSRRSDLDNESL